MKKQLWTLILPITFQQFMLALVSASDAIMLGRLNQSSLSAVSLAGQIAFVFNLFLAALTIGSSMFVAQYWGKKDYDSVERILSFVMRTTILISFVFLIGAAFCSKGLMEIFTNDNQLIKLGSKYLQCVGLSYLFTGISQIYLCMMKNSGQAIKSMVISSVTVIVNIVLNGVFIFGIGKIPSMGISGAAVATVVSGGIGMIWVIIDSLKPNHIRLRLTYLCHLQVDLEKKFWKYVLPVLANEIVWGCGFTMYSVIMGHLGSDAVAANSIANITKNLAICFCLGLGNGGSIIVGNELGAGNLEQARLYGKKLCKLAILSGAITGAFIVAISPLIIHFSGVSTLAKGYLGGMLLMSSYYLIGKSINCMTISGIFCAGGDSRFGFFCDLVTLWCIILPIGWVVAFVLDLPVLVVYFVLNLDELIKLPAVYINYKKYKWVKDLTIKEVEE